MKYYNITVNGTTYSVAVEEAGAHARHHPGREGSRRRLCEGR